MINVKLLTCALLSAVAITPVQAQIVSFPEAGNEGSFRVTDDSFHNTIGSFEPRLQMGYPVRPKVLPSPPPDTDLMTGEAEKQRVCTHVVERGDTLGRLAARYLGTSNRWTVLAHLNPGINPHDLNIGIVLNLPCPEPVQPVIPAWTAKAGEDFTTVLKRWGKIAGYRIVIRTSDVWALSVPIRLQTDFENAVAELVKGLGSGGRSPPVRVYSNKVIQLGGI